MLDCDPSSIDENPSVIGGVSPPELDVHVLERDRVARVGRENTGMTSTITILVRLIKDLKRRTYKNLINPLHQQ